MSRWSINITCPRCQFRGDVEEDFPCGHDADALRAEGAAQEREACAQLILTIPIGTPNDTPLFCRLAAAIRARGSTPEDGGANG